MPDIQDPDAARIELEHSALGSVLTWPDVLATLAPLRTDDFIDPAHRLIFDAMRMCSVRGPVTTALVADELAGNAGGLEYLQSLAAATPSRALARASIERLVEHAQERHQVRVLTEVQGSLDAGRMEEARATLNAYAQRLHGRAEPKVLDLRDLAGRHAPQRVWFIRDWLPEGVTLFAGNPGTGKSLLSLQIAMALALGANLIGHIEEPCRVLVWACEDDWGELWRRIEDIARSFSVDLDAVAERLRIVSRVGCENSILRNAHGELVATAVLDELRDNIDDHRANVVFIDNAAHVFAGDENRRADVTLFVNLLAGLAPGRPLATILLAHPARAAGSEFAGSAAWEAAARTRWYLGYRLPDSPGDDDTGEAESSVRYLARRKSNYSARDYVRLELRDGAFRPEGTNGHVSAVMAKVDREACERAVLEGFDRLKALGVDTTDKANSPDYLPRQILAKGLGNGHDRKDLAAAMNRLMTAGVLHRGVVGQYSNRMPRQGLARANGRAG